MKYISEKLYDKFLYEGFSVDEELAEDEGERDEVTFAALSPLDGLDESGTSAIIWAITVTGGDTLNMAAQVCDQLESFKIKEEVEKLNKYFERLEEKNPDFCERTPAQKDILLDVMQHKAFLKKVYSILLNEPIN